ncbi:hypothetical protein Tco_0584323 [Tanacetum coccineum]
MKVMQAYTATSNESHIPLPQAPIAPLTALPPSPMYLRLILTIETELQESRNQISEFQIRHEDEIVLARVRTYTLEILIEDIQVLPPPLAIRKLVADSVAAALEAQAATMENANNTNRKTRQRETSVSRKCSYKEFMSFHPFNFKGNDLKTYLRRFQELAVLCPTMVPNSEKLMEVFIGDYPEVLKEMLPLQSLKLWRKPLP